MRKSFGPDSTIPPRQLWLCTIRIKRSDVVDVSQMSTELQHMTWAPSCPFARGASWFSVFTSCS